MSTPVLATKLFVPVRRPRLVARPRLGELLDGTLDPGNRLTLVSAQAGFGKTTVLGDWLADLSRRPAGAGVGWVSLDEGDNDLARLLIHLVAALRVAGIEVDTAAVDPLHAASTPGSLTALVNEVTRASERTPEHQVVLVLDDYHVIRATPAHEAVTFLIDHLPDQLHLVIATRSDPPFPLARLRSRGQLTEVRAADLRFSPAEAREFLNHVMGLDLTTEDVEALEGRTEGWITGLQLAALSLQGIPERGEVDGFIEAFTGSNRFVIDYLADEVLARQPRPVREFLLHTAVLERLTGPLCDAVTGRTGSTRILEDLERSNLFLVPLDDQRSWYRYHHLFADVLRARLRAESPEREAGLHQRASDWFSSRGLVEDAVGHALAAQDLARAVHLMEEALPEMRRTRQDSLILGWVRSLPQPVVRRSPVLSILSGWSLMMSGDLDAAELRLDDAETALSAGAHDQDLAATWADTDDLRTAPATISVHRAALAQARGDVAGTVRHARRAMDLAGPADHLARGGGAGFLGLAAWAAGDVQEALSTFSEAVRSLQAAGNAVDALDSTVVLADLWVAAGRPGRARRLYEQALHSATGHGAPYPRATADLHVGLAELDRELDDLTGAEEHLEQARVLGERASITENRHRWCVARAQLCVANGDYQTATGLLARAESLYRPGSYPDVRPIAAMAARVRIAAGNLSSASGWLDDRGLTVDDAPDYLREYEHLTLVRLLLAQHRAARSVGRRPGSAPSVASSLGLLDRLLAAATSSGRAGSVVEIRVLQALAHDAAGDRPAALASLRQALVEAPEPESQVRLYLDEGAPMLALLHHAARGATPDAEAARRLLQHGGTTAASGDQRQALVDPLSQRELEVLRLLDSELTGPQIARELYVTLNTLRTHTRRIFTKLDVRTRAAAVHRARERGLL